MSGWTKEDLDRRNREVLGLTHYTAEGGWTTEGIAEQERRKVAEAVQWPEWMIEAECTRILEQDGWRALRTDPVSDKSRGKGFGELGMADHLYIRYPSLQSQERFGLSRGGFVELAWVEFKSAKGKPASHQIEWHAKERARGALTLIAGQDFPPSVEGFTEWYRNSGLMRNAGATK